jgi:hypothetical protein
MGLLGLGLGLRLGLGLGLGLGFSCDGKGIRVVLWTVIILATALITSSLLLRRRGAFLSDRNRGPRGVLLPDVPIESRGALGTVVVRVSSASGSHCRLWITVAVTGAVSVTVSGGGAVDLAGGRGDRVGRVGAA